MVVKLALVEVAAARTHALDGRLVAHVVVDLLQATVLPVEDNLLGTAFRLAQENAVDVVHHLLGMKHAGDAARDDGLAAFVVFVGDGPAAFHLRGEHHREGHEVTFLIKIDRLDVLVGERDVDVFRQSGGKSHRAVGRQVKRRLTRQFVPLRINQFQLDSVHSTLLILQKYKKI